jgi:hypothetical protein
MMTLEEIEDKLKESGEYIRTDKNSQHSYFGVYNPLFKRLRDSAKDVLEVGVAGGGSMLLWHEFFPNATIHGVDNKKEKNLFVQETVDQLDKYKRMKLYFGDAYNISFIKQNYGNKKFDVLIDDGSHFGAHQQLFIEHYLPLLSDDGIMVIEDIDIAFVPILVDKFPQELEGRITVMDRRLIKGRSDDVVIAYDRKG